MLALADQLTSLYQRRAEAMARAVAEHREWIRHAWPDHVRSFAREGRVPTAAEIIAEGDVIGWRAWGNEARSRARYEPIREAFEPKRLADLQERLDRARRAA